MEGVLKRAVFSLSGGAWAWRGAVLWREVLGLCISMFRVGLVGFGGGNALIPVIEAEVVKARKLVTAREYQEDVVAASITPGALPVEIAAGTGQRVAGSLGMILAASAMALPGVALLVLLLTLLSGEATEAMTIVRTMAIPIGGFIMSLLFLYTVKALRAEAGAQGGSWKAAAAIALAVFLLTGEGNVYKLLGVSMTPIFGLSTLSMLALSFFLILFFVRGRSRARVAAAVLLSALFVAVEGKRALLTGTFAADAVPVVLGVLMVYELVQVFSQGKNGGLSAAKSFFSDAARELSAWMLFLVLGILPLLVFDPYMIDFVARGYLSSLISFGGGDAYLTIADGLFVASGILPEAVFFSLLVPLVNVLPGSILCKVLTGIGFFVGHAAGGTEVGLLAALAGFVVSVAGSGMLFGLVARIIRTFRDAPAFQAISRWVRPIIGGLLVNVALSLLLANLKIASALDYSALFVEAVTALVVLVCLYLLLARRTGTVAPMLFSAAVGAGMLLF